MPILTVDDLLAALAAQPTQYFTAPSQTAEGAGTFHSLWRLLSPAALAGPAFGSGGPYTLDNTSTGRKATVPAVPVGQTASLALLAASGSLPGTLIFYDRLWHCSAILGNTASTQTIVTPGALSRFADGVGNELWVEFNSGTGTTASTLSVEYVDDAGATVTGTLALPNNAPSTNETRRIDPPAGSTGCRQVLSATLSVSTGTAGNMGLVIQRPITGIGMTASGVRVTADFAQTGLAPVDPNACLSVVMHVNGSQTGNIVGELKFAVG